MSSDVSGASSKKLAKGRASMIIAVQSEGVAESPTSGSDAAEGKTVATVLLAFSRADILPVGKGCESQHTSREFPLHQHSSPPCTRVAISFPVGSPTSAHVTLQMMSLPFSLSLSLSLSPRTHAVRRMELLRTTPEQPWKARPAVTLRFLNFHSVDKGVDCSNWSFIVHRIPLQWASSNTE